MGPQHPVGVRADQVGVDVHHLRLHPQPEVEAQRVDPVDQRVQATGPDVLVDRPVTEAPSVVPPAAEPAVVEHEPLHPHLGRGLGELGQPLEVMVEVDRLPRVDEHLPLCQMSGPRGGATQEVVEPRGDGVEALARPGADQPRGLVGLAPGQHHLAGGEQLAAAEHRLALGRPLGVRRLVAAPRDVDGPHLAGPEAEARRPGAQQQRRVVAGATVPAAALPGPLVPGKPLRHPLPDPPARQVEQLGGLVRHRQAPTDRHHLQPVPTGVRDGGARADQPLGRERELHPHLDLERGVRCRALHGVAGARAGPAVEPERRHDSGGARARSAAYP